MSLDVIDRAFLDLLQRNNRRALREYAIDLGISTPTCLRRLRRLEKRGAIQRHSAVLDPLRIGLSVQAYVEVALRNASGAHMAAFEKRMRDCSEVLQCAELAGHIDYLLTVVSADMAEFRNFTRKLADDNQVRKFRSLLVLRQSKSETCLPLGV